MGSGRDGCVGALAKSPGSAARARFPDRYSLGYPAAYMALVYNAADVPLAASNEEAFQYS